MNTGRGSVEGMSDLADGAPIFSERFHTGRIDLQTRAAQTLSFCPSMGQAGLDTLTDQGPFKLCKRPK